MTAGHAHPLKHHVRIRVSTQHTGNFKPCFTKKKNNNNVDIIKDRSDFEMLLYTFKKCNLLHEFF